MKLITAFFSITAIAFSLAACNTFNRVGTASEAIIDTAATGTVTAVDSGFDTVVSPAPYPFYRNDPIYFNNPVYTNTVIYRRGHSYQLLNGRYVRVD